MNFGFEIRLGSKRLRCLREAACTLRSSLFVSLLLVLALAMPLGSFAQGITGTITGTVTDATGAIVAGATVTVRNVDTNATHTVTTSDLGSYKVPQLQPGNYSVKAEKAGFKASEQSGITLQIDQIELVNAQLQVRQLWSPARRPPSRQKIRRSVRLSTAKPSRARR